MVPSTMICYLKKSIECSVEAVMNGDTSSYRDEDGGTLGMKMRPCYDGVERSCRNDPWEYLVVLGGCGSFYHL